jgi:uncharacterized membrane protein (UPF0127 family)
MRAMMRLCSRTLQSFRHCILSLAVAVALAVTWLMGPLPAGSAEQQTLEIVSKSGVHVFTVELAVSDEERQKGLMFRRSLPESQGMLFDFKADQDVSMWMRNTYVSLDMIFIRGDGRIQRIAENTQTESDRIIPSGGPVRAVLEVVAGTAKKFGIAAGDRVASPIFRR